jgi:hypothetical protein
VRAVESQNHYYGHSSAFAAYLGLDRPRHVAGLVQHGWTAVSPLDTHFRDFPDVGTARRPGRRLLVWSHTSRAWDPAEGERRSTPIGAPWHYLAATLGPGPEPSGTVIMPVHGIATQAVHGDHAEVARAWAGSEGPSTVCLYHVEADDPRVVAAYRDAGHRVVTLGSRTDPLFLARLHALVAGAARVVSNRLSTPVVYAAANGTETAVTGDPMRLDGERDDASERLRALWPELYDARVDPEERRAVAEAETGAAHVRDPEELRHLLGWDRRRPLPFLEHWALAPASRAVTTLRRRGDSSAAAAAPAASGAPAAPGGAASEGGQLGLGAFLAAATAYLPRPLGARAGVRAEPIPVA